MIGSKTGCEESPWDTPPSGCIAEIVSMEIKTGGLKVSSNSLSIENRQNMEKICLLLFKRLFQKMSLYGS